MNTLPSQTNPLYQQLKADRLAFVLAVNVKRLRKEARLTKSKFSLMVGIGRPFLDRIEKGEANPRLSLITQIADALEVDVVELLTPYEDLQKHPE